jgi:hypothetical protein
MFERLYKEQQEWRAGASLHRRTCSEADGRLTFSTRHSPAQPRQSIQVTLPSGDVKEGTSWETSPLDVAKSISKSLPDRIVIAKVIHEPFVLVYGDF